MIKAVLFDLDDTLLNSVKARVHALEHVFSDARIPLNAHDYLFGLNGSPFRDALKELELTYYIKEDLFIKYRRAYWFNSQDSLSLYPGVKDMLEKLDDMGICLGIVTSKLHDTEFEGRRIGCAVELEKIGISNLFTRMVGLEDVEKPKPDPECIHLALNEIGVNPVNTMVVGDTAADIEAGKRAGCVTCRAVWGITESEVEPIQIAADYNAQRPEDVISILESMR